MAKLAVLPPPSRTAFRHRLWKKRRRGRSGHRPPCFAWIPTLLCRGGAGVAAVRSFGSSPAKRGVSSRFAESKSIVPVARWKAGERRDAAKQRGPGRQGPPLGSGRRPARGQAPAVEGAHPGNRDGPARGGTAVAYGLARAVRPPLRLAALGASPPLDGGEERRCGNDGASPARVPLPRRTGERWFAKANRSGGRHSLAKPHAISLPRGGRCRAGRRGAKERDAAAGASIAPR